MPVLEPIDCHCLKLIRSDTANNKEIAQPLIDRAVNYKKSDFAAAIESRARGVDLILDPVGASYLEKNLTVLRENGRLVNIGLMGGASTAVDLGKILGKSLRIIGSRLRPRPLAEKIRITADFRERFWPLLSAGRLEPVVDSIFPIEQVRSAHDHVRANRNIGKVILAVKSDD